MNTPTGNIAGPASRESRAGFTLIELLTVIAVVVVLAAFLFPVVGAVKARGDSTKCLSNLSNLGKGFLAYSAEHEATFPSLDDTSSLVPGATSPLDWIFWIEKYVPYSQQVYVCPANTVRLSSDKIKDSDRITNYGISYWMRYGLMDPTVGGKMTSIKTMALPIARTGLLIDANSSWIKDTQVSRVSFVHGDSANLLYVDGRVESAPRSRLLDSTGKLIPCMGDPRQMTVR